MTTQPHSSPSSKATPFDELREVMRRLRAPKDGCPWDVEQNFSTIAPFTIEEAYEVADAIERDDMDDLREELGDLLFQVMFHSQMAEEAGHFDVMDVTRAISKKMVRRHPHVFERVDDRSAEAQTKAWESLKAEERADKNGAEKATSALDGVALALPALLRAEKLQKRAARTGFDWAEPAPIFDKLEEETREVKEAVTAGDPQHIEEEIGDMLFVCANLARRLGVDPEQALRKANAKFERRFKAMETLASRQNENFSALSLDQQETLWTEVKSCE